MASYQLIGPLPQVTLDAGCTITLEAIHALTGAPVSGVTVSQVAIYGVNAYTGAAVELEFGAAFAHAEGDL